MGNTASKAWAPPQEVWLRSSQPSGRAGALHCSQQVKFSPSCVILNKLLPPHPPPPVCLISGSVERGSKAELLELQWGLMGCACRAWYLVGSANEWYLLYNFRARMDFRGSQIWTLQRTCGPKPAEPLLPVSEPEQNQAI